VPEKPKEEVPKPINNPFVKSVTGEITSKKPVEEVKPSVFPKKTEDPSKKVEEDVVRSSVSENKVNNDPPKKL
jgi:hypothetical protein